MPRNSLIASSVTDGASKVAIRVIPSRHHQNSELTKDSEPENSAFVIFIKTEHQFIRFFEDKHSLIKGFQLVYVGKIDRYFSDLLKNS